MSGQQDKVVSISSIDDKNSSQASVGAARMPIALRKLQDKSRQGLMSLLQSLFDNNDDALFALADKAQSNSEQNIYFDSMREIRLQRRTIEAQFAQVIPQCFSDVYMGRSIEILMGKVEEVEHADLSLVQNEELEQSVAIETMVAKALLVDSNELINLSARLNQLIDSQTIDDSNNPVSPRIVCHSFKAACDVLSIDIKSRLVLFKLFEKFVLAALPELYQACNEMLIDEGVLPDLRADAASRTQARTSRRPGMQAANEDISASLEAIAQTVTGHAPTASDQTFSQLQQLIAEQKNLMPQAAANEWLMPGTGPQLQTAQLLTLLAQIQSMQEAKLVQMLGQQSPGDWEAQLSDLPDMLRSALADEFSGDTPLAESATSADETGSSIPSLGQMDYDAMNLVSMLFQFILDDENLPLPMKALIARLQIPVLKVAMLDKSFFSKGGHPARQLLNKIANAALGWTPAAEIGKDGKKDALLERVEAIVEDILQNFNNDISLFETTLADFDVFLASESRRTELIEKRTIDAESGKARADEIRVQVQDALNERIAGKKVPVAVTELLTDAWSNAMFLIAVKQGDDCEDWQETLTVVDDLLWSVSEQAGAERDRLLALLPDLLRRLRTGLTQINFDAFRMNELFAQLEKIHLQRLRNEPSNSDDEVVDGDSTSDTQAPAAVEVSAETREDASFSDVAEVDIEALDANIDLDSVDQVLAKTLLDDSEAIIVDDAESAEPKGSARPASADSRSSTDKALNVSDDQPVDATPEAEDEDLPLLSDFDNNDDIVEETVSEIVLVNDAATDDSETGSEEDDFYQQAESLSVGVWVEIRQAEGKKFRAKLAAITRPNNKYIFVNRAGMKVCERTLAGVAEELQRGSIALLDDSLLFDRALQSVIGNLRQAKN